ncbi:GNAT family N-acetyltransferase [Klebsiella oxytoca]|uniref:GNAT family N-acetyltransferase n=1 Tax=Klebsiella oxytoca TaxID=571 RepID=UPI0007CD0C8C|nr:GNAT family N-acetyltransferase [Klebsiella oxytoca]MBZ7324004.1 N-acetyltransferase [Klebsiella oxytoca]MCW9545220.1 GNAT family N-acetyltransferase [Klebsiella oxytoca]MCW9564266.1 GNAT family N-acetyltransferase [Klebsiella oxytoca]MCW9574703.1 GNAT family N-acetyltransferase [Klebsiella oxytoca]MEB6473764.1 N-acetyltransferase family protein [Klebsiella oxytoca]
MHIIHAEEQHITAIRNIYAHHVLQGTGSFETEPPDAQEMLNRLSRVQSHGFPWYIALKGDMVIGYCYLSRYRERHAYRFTVENSIYIDPRYQRQGIGKALLDRAVTWAQSQGYRQMIAVVGDSANVASIALHVRAGFTEIGTLKDIGFKHGRWLDTVFLQRILGEGNSTQPEDSDLTL